MGEDSGNPRAAAAALTGQLLSDPRVLAAFSQELNSMIGKSSGYIESLPKSVKRRIKALKKLQVEQFKLESDFYSEVHELECKYLNLYEPLHTKRKEIINAIKEPSDSDCEWDSDEEDEGDEAGDGDEDETKEIPSSENKKCAENGTTCNGDSVDEDTKGIPEFWFTVLKNITEFSDLIQEHDTQILKSLQDIRIDYLREPNKGFQIKFIFGSNDYFTNTELTKSYILRSEPNPDKPLSYDGPEIVRCEGCVIDWNPGKNVTEKKIKEKQTRQSSATKFVTKTKKLDSFFNFFSVPSESKDDVEDEDVLNTLLADFELGQMLHDRIVPRAVLYFTGDALDEESEDEGDEDDDEDEGVGIGALQNGDKDGESGDEDDPDYVPPKNMKEGPPDCRQQ